MCYLFGSIPFAYIVGRWQGVDVFNSGSKQAGATNVWRLTSPRYGIGVFLADFAKGVGAILFCRWVGISGPWLYMAVIAVIIGHWNSIFTRFRGGDGVSSMAGLGFGIIGLAIMPAFIVLTIIGLGFNSRLKHPAIWASIGCVTVLLIQSSVFELADLPWASIDLNSRVWQFLVEPLDFSTAFIMTLISTGTLLHSKIFRNRLAYQKLPDKSKIT